MYPNFNAERARKGITLEAIADALGMTVPTVSLKLSGKSPITFAEAIKLKRIVGVDIPLEILFSEEAVTY